MTPTPPASPREATEALIEKALNELGAKHYQIISRAIAEQERAIRAESEAASLRARVQELERERDEANGRVRLAVKALCRAMDLPQAVVEAAPLTRAIEHADKLRAAEGLAEALRGMLLSADASWETDRGGHDWPEACVASRAALSTWEKAKEGEGAGRSKLRDVLRAHGMENAPDNKHATDDVPAADAQKGRGTE